MMGKNKFVRWYIIKSFRSHIKQWIIPIIVLVCGLLIINVCVSVYYSVQTTVKENFTDNKDLNLITINYDASSASFSNKYMESLEKQDLYEFSPAITYKTEPLDVEVGGEVRNLRYIALPYNMLAYIELDTQFTEEEWNTQNIIVGKENVGFGRHVRLPAHPMLKQHYVQSAEVLNGIQGLGLDVDVVEFTNMYLPKKWENMQVIPIEMWYRLEALSLDESVDKFKERVEYPEGMFVTVNEFSDIDLVAQKFLDNGYIAEYGLSNFKNMTDLIKNVSIISVIFTILILVITIITNYNAVRQFLYTQRHQFGLMKSMGIAKKTILTFTFGEILFQGMLSFIIYIPIQVGLSCLVIYSMFPEYSYKLLQINVLLLLLNASFILIISILGGVIPILNIIREKTIMLLNKGE